jgi:hypothetical protein
VSLNNASFRGIHRDFSSDCGLVGCFRPMVVLESFERTVFLHLQG